jgi:hypothetical protein
MIPVISTAVLTNTKWVKRLYESIDYPTENFCIFNNSGKLELAEELEELRTIDHKYVQNLHLVNLPGNIGVAGYYNLTIKSFLMAPYWIITGDDVAFTSGFLEEMFIAAQDKSVGLVHGYGGDFNDGAWDLFLIKDWVIQEFGLFDENTYPAYCEDVDYIMKTNRKVKKVPQLKSKYLHGPGLAEEYYSHGSQTKKTNDYLNNHLDNINLMNFDYMFEKWGPGWRMTEPYKDAFNNPSINNKFTYFDLEFVRKKHLKL